MQLEQQASLISPIDDFSVLGDRFDFSFPDAAFSRAKPLISNLVRIKK